MQTNRTTLSNPCSKRRTAASSSSSSMPSTITSAFSMGPSNSSRTDAWARTLSMALKSSSRSCSTSPKTSTSISSHESTTGTSCGICASLASSIVQLTGRLSYKPNTSKMASSWNSSKRVPSLASLIFCCSMMSSSFQAR